MSKRAAALVGLAAIVAAASFALASGARPPPSAEVDRCAAASAIDFGCFERRYTALTRSRGARSALRDLAGQRQQNGYVRAACHQLTHRIGRAAGAIRGMPAFRDGDPLCSSGYYHGVIEAVMTRIGTARALERATGVCAQLRERDYRSADHYNCAHGMGHGFMGRFGSDVFASLHGCDALTERWERRHCYGGVFMENLSAIDNSERPSTALRPSQPLYPCTEVARRYKEACFDKQTTYALYITGGDFAAVFKLCSSVGRGFRGACDRGLGGDVAIDSAKHLFTAKARAASRRSLCMLGEDGRARANCVIGAVRVILRDLAGGAAQTATLCQAFTAPRLRRLRQICVRARDEAYRELPLQPGT